METTCPLCRSNDTRFVTDRTREGNGTVHRCGACTHVFLDLGLGAEELASFLDDFYRSDSQRSESIRDEARYLEAIHADNVRRLAACAALLRPETTLLDVGAGYGLFSYLARPFVERVTMVDRSELSERNAERFGIAHAQTVDELTDPCSLIVAFHTVEHFVDPVAELRTLRLLLAPGGRVVIEVPNVRDLLVAAAADYRPFYYQTAHLHYFSRRTLGAALARAGLKVERSVPTQRYGFANHVRWVTGRTISEVAPLERLYRAALARTPWSDTLFVVCRARRGEAGASRG